MLAAAAAGTAADNISHGHWAACLHACDNLGASPDQTLGENGMSWPKSAYHQEALEEGLDKAMVQLDALSNSNRLRRATASAHTFWLPHSHYLHNISFK